MDWNFFLFELLNLDLAITQREEWCPICLSSISTTIMLHFFFCVASDISNDDYLSEVRYSISMLKEKLHCLTTNTTTDFAVLKIRNQGICVTMKTWALTNLLSINVIIPVRDDLNFKCSFYISFLNDFEGSFKDNASYFLKFRNRCWHRSCCVNANYCFHFRRHHLLLFIQLTKVLDKFCLI